MGPRGRGTPCGGGRALDPRCQVPALLVVFLVPNILKYSRKNHVKFFWQSETFYFWVISIAQEFQNTGN